MKNGSKILLKIFFSAPAVDRKCREFLVRFAPLAQNFGNATANYSPTVATVSYLNLYAKVRASRLLWLAAMPSMLESHLIRSGKLFVSPKTYIYFFVNSDPNLTQIQILLLKLIQALTQTLTLTHKKENKKMHEWVIFIFVLLSLTKIF